MKTIDELLDEYKEACYGNGWEAGLAQERGAFYPEHVEDETTPRLAILNRFKELEATLVDLKNELNWYRNKYDGFDGFDTNGSDEMGR